MDHYKLTELPQIASKLVNEHKDVCVWVFDGEMGAGKTTLIKEVCNYLGVQDNISSPTFSLVNEYHSDQSDVFYHFDFYRIEDEEEAIHIGVDDYFYSGRLCFVEWASNVASLIPDEYVHIQIEIQSENSRSLTATRYGEKA